MGDSNVFVSTVELFERYKPTPLVRMSHLSAPKREVYAKLEFFNPFSRSIKDRPVFHMFMEAKKRGVLDGGKELFEATSGNTGISLAALCSIMGIKFRVYIPKPTPQITEILLKIFGAEIIRTEWGTLDMDAVKQVKEEAEKYGAVNLNQFENDDNFNSHYLFTAREIDEQLKSVRKKPDVIVAGCGTSGHIAALSKYFKKKYPEVKIIGVVPAQGEKIPGIKGLETQPKWFFQVEVDDVIEVTQIGAIEGAIEIARNEGLFIGLSAGAVVQAYKKVFHRLGNGTYVLIFPDDGFKYIEAFKKYFSSSRRV